MAMQINSFLGSALAAYQAGQRRIDDAGAAIATSAVPAVSNSLALIDLGEQMLELRGGQYDAMAAVRMIRSADEVLGTLIDTQA